jgi:glycosyltransferase involved in cell wall biosynthesis
LVEPVPSVLFVAHDVGPLGGMERQCMELVARLDARGHDVTVVTRRCILPEGTNAQVLRLPLPSRPFPLAYPLFALVASIVVALRKRSILHVTGAIVINRAQVCTIHFCHAAFRRRGLRRARKGSAVYRLSARVSDLLALAGERGYVRHRRPRTIVAVSADVGEEFARYYPDQAMSLAVVPNGVDVNVFRPDSRRRSDIRRALQLSDDTPTCLFVGGDWERKGLSIAIRALVWSEPWHLIVVGDGDSLREIDRGKELGVAERLHFVGRRDDPEQFYSAADAFVLPSSYEAFPLVLLEAASSGLPIIATEFGASRQFAETGGFGLIVDRTPEAVAAALGQLRAEPRAATEMALRARAAASAYSWDRVVDEYARIYRGVSAGVA